MKVIHKGLAIELDADDPRIRLIEVVLFEMAFEGIRSLDRDGASVPEAPSASWHRYWKSLPRSARRELELLSEGRRFARDIEKELGLDAAGVRGMHRVVNGRALKCGVSLRVKVAGRGGAHRAYWLDEEARRTVAEIMRLERVGSDG